MKEVHNFNAGPCVLPKEAVESTINAIRNFDNTGIGLMEISHRTPGWERVMAETRQLWRDLLNIPDTYEVLFLGGGASTQFFMVPANLMKTKAAYLQTGVWAKKAAKEAKLFGKVDIVASSEEKTLLMSDINPAVADALLARGYEYGQSRVIAGYHWQSDVDAGRLGASVLYAKLQGNERFRDQLAKAQQEFRDKTQGSSKVKEVYVPVGTSRAYTITGVRATSETRGIIIQDGKKILRP